MFGLILSQEIIIERENYNTGEGKAKVQQVTAEKREAIIDALKYFQMIE